MIETLTQLIPTLAVAVIIFVFLLTGLQHKESLMRSGKPAIFALFDFTKDAILPLFVFFIGIMVCLFDFSLVRGLQIIGAIFVPMILIWAYNRVFPFKNLNPALEGLYQNAATQPFLMCGYGFIMIIGTKAEKNLATLTVPLLVALGMIYTLVVLNTNKGIGKKMVTLSKQKLFQISLVSLAIPVILAAIHNYWFKLNELGDFYKAFANPGTVDTSTLSGACAIAFQKIILNFHNGYKWCGFVLAVALIGPFMPKVKQAFSSVMTCLKESCNRRVFLQKMVVQGLLTFAIGWCIGMRGVDLKVVVIVSSGFASIIPFLIYISNSIAAEKVKADSEDEVLRSAAKNHEEIAAEADGFIQLFTAMLVVSPFTVAFFAFFSTWMENFMAG